MDRRLDYLVRELLVGITLNQPPLAGSKNWARRPNCTTTRIRPKPLSLRLPATIVPMKLRSLAYYSVYAIAIVAVAVVFSLMLWEAIDYSLQGGK